MCRHLSFFMLLLTAVSAFGFYDNRYFAPAAYERSKVPLFIKPFWMRATESFGDFVDENRGLYEVSGKYNQKIIDDAIVKAGLSDTSLFRSDWRSIITDAPWQLAGVMEAYGAEFHGFLELRNWIGIGFDWAVMHVRQYMEMIRDPEPTATVILGPGDERDILLNKAEMHRVLGLTPGYFSKWGMTDLDIFMHVGISRDYYLKCRHFDVGARVGALIPTSPVRNLNNPASLPFDGNGHWGLYLNLEGEFVLKQDMTAGLIINFTKRFPKTMFARMPVFTEPFMFGALQGNLNVDPGLTWAVVPYLFLDDLRDGLGVRAAYTIMRHHCDSFTDMRICNNSVTPDFEHYKERTPWGREYFSVGVVYDWAFSCPESRAPRTALMWDIPVDGWFVVERAYKTYALSVTIEWDF